MVITRGKTATTSVKWEVELFPFSNPYPNENDFGGIGSVAASFISGNSGGPSDGQHKRIVTGIKQMNFVRTKKAPDSQCSFTVLGQPPRECIPGTWMIISSYTATSESGEQSNSGQGQSIPAGSSFKEETKRGTRKVRFIGQITSLDTSYQVNPDNGNITQSTIYYAREWSQCLSIPVRLDLYAFALTASTGFAQIVETLAPTGVSIDAINELIKKSMNPFEVAHLILAIVGAMNSDDSFSKIENLGMEGFKNVAVKMPSVPQSLLDRLGINATPADAFTSGFVKVITGVQTEGFQNDGTWNGVFGANGDTLEFFSAAYFDKNPSDRPSTLAAGAIVQSGLSAWQMLQSYCDPSINEFFTDFVHELNPDGTIGARPVLFIRDKPFSMRYVEEEVIKKPSLLKTFTKYDDLPRIRIPSEYLMGLRISNTVLNSPNFIRVNFGDFASNPEVSKAQSNFRPPVRLGPEINRFGGNELDVQSNFLGYNDNVNDVSSGSAASQAIGAIGSAIGLPPSGFDFVSWVDKIKAVTQSWHAYDYRMGAGTVILKDDNFSLTLGFNLEFQMGDFNLVGHIETINTTVSVNEKGTYITQTQVQLSRIVMHDSTKNLKFIHPQSFTYLGVDPATPGPKEALSLGSALDANLDSLPNFSNFV